MLDLVNDDSLMINHNIIALSAPALCRAETATNTYLMMFVGWSKLLIVTYYTADDSTQKKRYTYISTGDCNHKTCWAG